ncbi:dihydrolipoamide acetyltransferase component of pyruvate dehydrogenase complex [Saccharopolyspora subtropica]|uniref:Acetyltransferase component of pyruvate dehydrogenase complex n=1 Tax=Saccharopolyspora thermophila TaxID=89367 RepID=A0A917N7Y6_9PSEU|nr:pyruvate dehydrogenase complex dihydrolipoamide acetyltransferase [Saccharopolyspora subtropica]GGI76130.1 dihydrolipoamide acetyltransferase component of pyruvate dehydrogenase complex [Saccharopolyspora subtropica]
MTEIQMPRLSDTMEEGVISTWRKKVGDQVSRGDVIAEIETDKAVMELEAYDDGVLEKILVEEGATVPIGTPIAILGDGSGAAAEAAASPAPAAPAEPAPAPAVPAAPAAAPAPAAESGARPKASPLAKAVAKEKGVDLSTVRGTGPGGRIIRADIEAAAAAQSAPAAAPAAPAAAPAAPAAAAAPAASADVEEIPLSNIRKVTARRLTESKQQAPHFYLTSAIDVTDLMAFRANLNERLQAAGGPKVSVNDLIVKAVATALRAYPAVNVSFAGDTMLQHKRINLGVAVAIDNGLVVPVIKDADRKSVSEIAVESRELAGRAREGKLKLDEMSGGTFSISNLGMFGIEQFSAVINPPEAAILAVGAARDEVQVRDGEFVARKILRVTLSADHRAVDGAVGAAFLQQLTSLLEDPIRIIA